MSAAAFRVADAVRYVRAVHDSDPVRVEERRRNFNETTGVLGYISKLGRTGGNQHPDRCRCQGGDTIPHKHYGEPHGRSTRCARCLECDAYVPHDAVLADA